MKTKWSKMGAMIVLLVGATLMVEGQTASPRPVATKAAKAEHKSSASANNAVHQVNAVFDRYIDGWKRGDLDALAKVYATDARVTGIWPDPTLSYPVQGWSGVRDELVKVTEFSEKVLGGGMEMGYSPRHIEIYGNAAILTTNWTWLNLETSNKDSGLAIAKSGKNTYGKGQATFIFVRRGSSWVLVHEHVSVLPTTDMEVEKPTALAIPSKNQNGNF